jgi:hypothetical protein
MSGLRSEPLTEIEICARIRSPLLGVKASFKVGLKGGMTLTPLTTLEASFNSPVRDP